MKLFVGAKGIIARPDGKVLIVRESDTYEDGIEAGIWDVVGGRIEADEPLLAGMQREIMEESGLTVVVGSLLGVSETFPLIKGKPCHIVRVYYACTTEEPAVHLSSDHDTYDWIDPADHAEINLMEDLHEIFTNYLKLI